MKLRPATDIVPIKPGSNGRDAFGRFVNLPGPGRPPKRTEEQYRLVTVANCTLSDWAEITQRAVEDAKLGDPNARRWLSDTLLGKPSNDLLSVKFVQSLVKACSQAFAEANRFDLPEQRRDVFSTAMLTLRQQAIGDLADDDDSAY